MALNPQEARRRKNANQRKYAKKTGYEAQRKYDEKHKGERKLVAAYIPTEQAEQFKAKCRESRTSQTEIISKAIANFLKNS